MSARSTRSARLAAVLVASLALAGGAHAQMRPSFGVMAGAALPTGDFAKSYKSGYTVGALLGLHPEASPIGFRIDGAYSRFDFKGTNAGGLRTSILQGTGNVVLGGGGEAGMVKPYFIGGIGIYNVKVDASSVGGSVSDTKFGFNGGAGLDLPLTGISAFVEARYHYIMTDNGNAGGSNTAYVPIAVGIRF